MTARLKVTVLGSGASPGVPRIGNDWGACDPNEPRNRRRRCAILLEKFLEFSTEPTRVLIDAGPDIREQLLDAEVGNLDGVIFTHPHADHIHGIDDLRAIWLNTRERVEVYSDDVTRERLLHAFRYCFEAPAGSPYPPILNHNPIVYGERLVIDGAGGELPILPFRQVHGDIISMGIRVAGFAYSSDISDVPDESLESLSNLDVWMVDALRYAFHPSHFNVDQALDWINRLTPRRAVLTHLHGDLDYRVLSESVPDHVDVAYDGMTLDLDIPE